jgi:hypothetical protein
VPRISLRCTDQCSVTGLRSRSRNRPIPTPQPTMAMRKSRRTSRRLVATTLGATAKVREKEAGLGIHHEPRQLRSQGALPRASFHLNGPTAPAPARLNRRNRRSAC